MKNKLDIVEFVKGKCDEIIENYKNTKKKKCIMAYQRFNEYLLRLDNRYHQLCAIEDEMKMYMPGDDIPRPLEEMQLDYVDKVESFHQHVYAVISALVMLLTHIMKQGDASQLPINSVKRFLDYVAKNKICGDTADKHISLLLKSVEFRSKFIDHPQQHALQDWMTYSYNVDENACAVIVYFTKRGNEVYVMGDIIDPHHIDFKPPINCESFYVAPYHKKVYSALLELIKQLLRNIRRMQKKKK